MSTTITTPAEKNTDLVTLAGEINAEHEAVQVAIRDSVDRARRIGDMLNVVKRQLDHGQFGPWLKASVHFSERTARGYMRIARNWATLEKTATVADLPMRDALKLLTDPRAAAIESRHDEPVNKLATVSQWIDELWARMEEMEGDENANLEDWTSLVREAEEAQSQAAELMIRSQRRLGQHLNELDAAGITLDAKIKKRECGVPFIEHGRKYFAFDGHDNCIEIVPTDDPKYVYAAIYRMSDGEHGSVVYMKRGIAAIAGHHFIENEKFTTNELGWMSAPHDGSEPWYIVADRQAAGGAA